MNQYDLTAGRLAEGWNEEFSLFMTRHPGGVLQLGGEGHFTAVARYEAQAPLSDRLITLEGVFACRSMLNPTNRLESTGRILLSRAGEGGMQTLPAGYFLEYEDNGDFSLRLGKNGAEGIVYLGEKVSVETRYTPFTFCRLQFGFFAEGDGVRGVAYLDGCPILDAWDVHPDPSLLAADSLFFQTGANILLLRGTDTDAALPIPHPIPAQKVGDLRTWDISALPDYDFRTFITLFNGRVWTDDNGAVIPYRLYLPTHYTPEKRYPLVTYLHGAGLKGEDNLYQLAGDTNVYKACLDYQQEEEFILLVPQCAAPSWNEGDYDLAEVFTNPNYPFKGGEASITEVALLHLLEALQKEFSVDEHRLYISGGSMGGMGSYGLIGRHPQMFAAAFIGCAVGDTAMAAVYAETPLLIAHGTLDPLIPVERGREMAQVITAAGGEVEYREYPDKYHDFTDRAELVDTLRWLLARVR